MFGRAYDINGVWSDEGWWSREAQDALRNRTTCFENQYSGFELFGDSGKSLGYVDGIATAQDNIELNAGVALAHDAFLAQHKDAGEDASKLFFLSFAQARCMKETDDRALATADLMSAYIKVNGVAMNSEAFARAFKCQDGAPMNPPNKCKVW
ncbi:hypothetical protein ATCC90586_000307 [Pythium insidiosum]|nr:hypothetical protein ATCC90586_000307 [Pythium insidiosum]